MRITPMAAISICAALLTNPLGYVMSDACASSSPDNYLPIIIADSQQNISFAEAWQMVLLGNDSLAAGRANIERAEHLQDAARDLYFPQITAAANYTRLDKPVEIKPSDLFESMPAGDSIADMAQMLGINPASLDKMFTSRLTERDVFTSSIRAVWPIFTGGRITAAQDIAKGRSEEAHHLLAMEQQARFEDLAKFYFGVALTQQVLQTRIDVENGLKKHFDHALKLEQQGQIAKVERPAGRGVLR